MAEATALQIIPATGWSAVTWHRANDGTIVLEAWPLVCWALYEDDLDGSLFRYVAGQVATGDGLVGEAEKAVAREHFLGYIGPGEDKDMWAQAAYDAAARLEAR